MHKQPALIIRTDTRGDARMGLHVCTEFSMYACREGVFSPPGARTHAMLQWNVHACDSCMSMRLLRMCAYRGTCM